MQSSEKVVIAVGALIVSAMFGGRNRVHMRGDNMTRAGTPSWIMRGKICRCPGCKRWLLYEQKGPAKMRFATEAEVKEMTKGAYGIVDSPAPSDILYGARTREANASEPPERAEDDSDG